VSGQGEHRTNGGRGFGWLWLSAVALSAALLFGAVWLRIVAPPAEPAPKPTSAASGAARQVVVSGLRISAAYDPQRESAPGPAMFTAQTPEVVVSFAWRAAARSVVGCRVQHEQRPVEALSGSVDTGEHRSGTAAFRLRRPSAGWPEGRYQVVILCSGVPLARGAFTVQREAEP